jgi:hypothetical protein
MSWIPTFLLGAVFGSTAMLVLVLLAARRRRRRRRRPPEEPKGVDLDKVPPRDRLRVLGDYLGNPAGASCPHRSKQPRRGVEVSGPRWPPRRAQLFPPIPSCRRVYMPLRKIGSQRLDLSTARSSSGQ